MASSVGYRQDMPPKGGFKPIDYTKKVTFKTSKGFKILGIFIAAKIAEVVYIRYHIYLRRDYDAEKGDARVALSPFRLAESDRLYLKHLRDLRDEERELMKDVPGWEVGTLFGEPLYHKEKREFIMPPSKEPKAFTESLTAFDYIRLKFFDK